MAERFKVGGVETLNYRLFRGLIMTNASQCVSELSFRNSYLASFPARSPCLAREATTKLLESILILVGIFFFFGCPDAFANNSDDVSRSVLKESPARRIVTTRCPRCRCYRRPSKGSRVTSSTLKRARCLRSRKSNTSKRKPTPTPTRTQTSTPTPLNTPTPIATPTPAGSPSIPLLTEWEANMKKYGYIHCEELSPSSPLTESERLTAVQYDAEWVFYQIAQYTHDTSWLTCAQRAEVVYRDHYVIPNNGVIPAHMNFTSGLLADYLSTGDPVSKSAVMTIATNAAYCPDYTPLSWTIDASMSREVAYAIRAQRDAEVLGVAHRARTDALVDQALGHMDQWFVTRTAEYVRPFLFARTAEVLIAHYELTHDPRILPAVERGARWIWNECWLPEYAAFKYTDRVVASGGTEPAPDLNLLIAPIYAWLWNQTGDPIYRDMADQIFAGGVRGAWLVGAKQFNQNYTSSFDYVRWRSATPSPSALPKRVGASQ